MAIHTQTQKTKQKKNKTQHSASDPLPLGCAMFVFFCFFCFLFFVFLVSWFFGFLVCVWIAQTLPMGLNCLFFFFVFSRFWPNCKKLWKNQEKQKKNKKFRPMSPARPLPRPCPWVWTFFLFFPLLFWMFFMWRCFHHSTSQKMHVSTICTPAPPRPNWKKKHGKTKNHLMTYIMTNIMINIMIIIIINIMINKNDQYHDWKLNYIMINLMVIEMKNLMTNIMIIILIHTMINVIAHILPNAMTNIIYIIIDIMVKKDDSYNGK